MKTVTLDWETYIEEKHGSEIRGFRNGMREARRIFLELLAGASIEALGIDEEELMKFAMDLKPRIDRERK